MNSDGGVSSENLSRKLKSHQNLTRITDIVFEDLLRFTMLSRRTFLRMRNVLHKSYKENQNKRLMFNDFFFPKIVQFVR
jgi:hypothetical protein